jgi:hypothetical protein
VKSLGSHVAAVSGSCQGRVPKRGQRQKTKASKLTAHVCKLLAAALKVIAVLGLDGILNSTGHRVVGTEYGTLHKLDLTGHAALEATSCSDSAAGLLSLTPCCGRAGLAPRVW